MALPRTEVTTGLLEELERFKALIQPLTPAEWAMPSRCTGWTLTREGWGPTVLALNGIPEFPVNANGGAVGSRFTGDPLAFVLAATGRSDPAPLGLDESANIYR